MQNSNAAGLDLFTLHPLNGNPSDFLYFALGFGPQPKMIYTPGIQASMYFSWQCRGKKAGSRMKLHFHCFLSARVTTNFLSLVF